MSKKKPATKKPTSEDPTMHAAFQAAGERAADKIMAALSASVIEPMNHMKERVDALEAQLATHTKEIVRLSLKKQTPWWRFW